MSTTRLAIHGAAGRMGKRLVALGGGDAELEIRAALESASHPQLGLDAGVIAGQSALGIALASTLEEPVDAVIDFSLPEAASRVIALCLDRAAALVMATTGLTDEQHAQLHQAAEKIAIVWAPNMSLAVNLTMKLATMAADALKSQPSGVDVEIIERHHRFKEDAPSGTALKFGELIADVMGHAHHVHGRQGRPGERRRDEIGYHALRVGDNPGEHTIVFGLLGESIELKVAATNRDSYAIGALQAAKFVARQPPGLYSMFDVLGIA